MAPATLGVGAIRRMLVDGDSLADLWASGALGWLLLHTAALVTIGWAAYQWFVPMFFLFAAVAGQGDQIVAGTFEWSFDAHRTAWLLVGFVAGTFFFLQAQKMFWRQVGEIQAGTLERVYLSPLPTWLLTAVGRILASILETLVVVGTLYTAVALTVGVDIAWAPAALIALALSSSTARASP